MASLAEVNLTGNTVTDGGSITINQTQVTNISNDIITFGNGNNDLVGVLLAEVTLTGNTATDSGSITINQRGGPGCLNRFSASISGASASVRLPSGEAAG